MDIRFSGSNRIYIRNSSKSPIKVLIAPNKDWILGDLAFIAAKAVYTMGGSAAVDAAAKGGSIISIKNLYSLYKVYSKIKKVSKLRTTVSSEQLKTQLMLIEKMFDTEGLTIAPGDCIMVNEKALLNSAKGVLRYLSSVLYVLNDGTGDPSSVVKAVDEALSNGKDKSVSDLVAQVSDLLGLLNPSNFTSIFSFVGDMTLFVTSADFKKFTAFNSNSDHSWIVKEDEIVRSVYGSTDKEDRNEGRHIFSLTLGDTLNPGEFLEPFESLDVETSNYNFIGELEIPKIPQMEGSKSAQDDGFFDKVGNVLHDAGAIAANIGSSAVNLVTTAVEGVVNLPKNIGSAPYKLIYQPDGNLVLYRVSGDISKPKWASNTANTATYKTIMQEDGNLVVYAAEGLPVWALWRNPGKEYHSAFIRLDDISGNIGYYRKGASSPDFNINELSYKRYGNTLYPVLAQNEY